MLLRLVLLDRWRNINALLLLLLLLYYVLGVKKKHLTLLIENNTKVINPLLMTLGYKICFGIYYAIEYTMVLLCSEVITCTNTQIVLP